MKSIYLILVAILFCTCDDFLDKQPLSDLNSATFWKTESDVKAALAATYSTYRTDVYGSRPGSNGVSFAIDCLSDDAVSRSGYFNIQGIMHGGISPTTTGAIPDTWRFCYEGISNCNYFLENIDKASSILTPANYNKYKGEALFNRCYYYNELVQRYGDVPLILKFLTINDDVRSLVRTPKLDVVTQILQDIDVAIAGLPNVAYTDGHAVRGSAIMLKVRILLNNAEANRDLYAQAAATAYTLIGDPANPFRLHNNYPGIFFGEQKGNKEIMFSVQYQSPGDLHQLDQYIGNRMSFYPTTQLRQAYETSPKEDPRLRMTIFLPGDPWVMGKSAGGKFPATAGGGGAESGVPPTIMAFKKWINPALNTDQARGTVSDQHIVKMRYAELLLSYAEAMFESGQGNDPKALKALNDVRARTGVAMPAKLVLDRATIRNERRVELAFEGLRFNDLIRWRTAEAVIPTIPGNNQVRKFDGYLWPIPQNEMNIMAGVWQNNAPWQ